MLFTQQHLGMFAEGLAGVLFIVLAADGEDDSAVIKAACIALHTQKSFPLCAAVTEADVIALNHFTNLRPLWIPDNLKKGAKQTHLL